MGPVEALIGYFLQWERQLHSIDENVKIFEKGQSFLWRDALAKHIGIVDSKTN